MSPQGEGVAAAAMMQQLAMMTHLQGESMQWGGEQGAASAATLQQRPPMERQPSMRRLELPVHVSVSDAVQYTEFRVVKTNIRGKRQRRIMGISADCIFNKPPPSLIPRRIYRRSRPMMVCCRGCCSVLCLIRCCAAGRVAHQPGARQAVVAADIVSSAEECQGSGPPVRYTRVRGRRRRSCCTNRVTDTRAASSIERTRLVYVCYNMRKL